jgi:hypothetical protein
VAVRRVLDTESALWSADDPPSLLAEAMSEPMDTCTCGHSHALHMHYCKVSYCLGCEACKQYQRKE